MSETIVIKTYITRIDAEMDKALLQSNSIQSFVSANDCGGVYPLGGIVRLLIFQEDVDKAKKILIFDEEV